MTNITASQPFKGSTSRLTIQGAEIQAEVEAAIENLGAERLDIERLLVPIKENALSRQHLSVLLKQAWDRLQKLRGDLADLTAQRTADAEITELIARAASALQTGQSFSFENAWQALEAASGACLEHEGPPETAASILAMQGKVAALRQKYLIAGEHYAGAAKTPGLSIVLQWQYLHEQALILADLGREFGDKAALAQAISLLENEVVDLAQVNQRPADWATTQNSLGNVYGILGQRQNGTRNLENSIAAFKASLEKRDRELAPLQWSATQNNLGNALGILGHRQNDEDMLVESVLAFERALEERTRDLVPKDRATTLNNLAAVLQTLGQRNKDAKMLKRSVELYKEVLQEWTRESVPLDWATTMDNMGTALRLLGEHRKGPRTLEQSVAAYNSALSERSRERSSDEWARTQNNLGAALQKLAEREENPETLAMAVSAYENALKEWTPERLPMAWAMTMANLGVARRRLAEVTEDAACATKAVEELEAVSEVFRNASHAQYSELSIDQLAQARKLADALARA